MKKSILLNYFFFSLFPLFIVFLLGAIIVLCLKSAYALFPHSMIENIVSKDIGFTNAIMNVGVNISLYLVLFFVGKRLLVKNGNSSSGYIKNIIRTEIHGWKASNTILFFSAITFCACTLMVIAGALPPKTLYPRYRIFTMIALAPFFEEFYFRYVYFRCVKIATIDFLWLNAIFFGIQHYDRFVNPFSLVVTIVLSFFIISLMYYVTESYLLTILIHMAWNVFAIITANMKAVGNFARTYIDVFFVLAAISGAVLYFLLKKTNGKKTGTAFEPNKVHDME